MESPPQEVISRGAAFTVNYFQRFENAEATNVLDLREFGLLMVPLDTYGLLKLVEIRLDYHRIESFPQDLAIMTHVHTLSVSHNSLKHCLSAISTWTRLMYLDLSHNKIEVIFSEIGGLIELKFLSLEHNLIQVRRQTVHFGQAPSVHSPSQFSEESRAALAVQAEASDVSSVISSQREQLVLPLMVRAGASREGHPFIRTLLGSGLTTRPAEELIAILRQQNVQVSNELHAVVQLRLLQPALTRSRCHHSPVCMQLTITSLSPCPSNSRRLERI